MNDKSGSGGHPALTDIQTGLPNQLYFETVFDVLFATGPRGIPLTLILLEADGFQDWITGADAEEVGRTLRAMGATLGRVVRRSDILARVGETRFALCLLDCNMAGAVLVADRIDGLLDGIRDETGLGFTIGGASFDVEMEKPDHLLGAAEEALRTARRRGANQTEFFR
jgi:diguanylate cyclase (GGDEF)-like protein